MSDSILAQLNPSDDYFDAAQGLYWYASDWHGGQSSELYSILSTMGYSPGACERGPEPDSIAEMIYADLESGAVEPSEVLEFVNLGYNATRD